MKRREEEIINSGSSRCQDCGNQAKKGCEHLRCRSCCKSRGFQCPTHVKSTWTPVSRRRPRNHIMHQQISAIDLLHGPAEANPKRYRQVSTLGNFPREMCFPAIFRCVRVSSIDDNAVDQYAYQTSVSIGGHIFTGILYDHGPEPDGTGDYVTGGSSSAGAASLLQQPNSITRTTIGTASSSYASPFLAFNGSNSQLFHYPRS